MAKVDKKYWKPLKELVDNNVLPFCVRPRSIPEKSFVVVAHNEIGAIGYDEQNQPWCTKFHESALYIIPGSDVEKPDTPREFNSFLVGTCLRKAGFDRQPTGIEKKYNQISYRCKICGKWHLSKVGTFK